MDNLHRIIATITALTIAGVVVGLPQPAPVNKPSAVAFPCQHHACGCVDAEMCRTSCGCFKPRVKSCCAGHVATHQPDERENRDTGLVLRSTTCSGVCYLVVALTIPLMGPELCSALPPADRSGHPLPRGASLPDSRALRPSLPPPRA